MSPSRQHEFVAWAVPRLRKSRDLDTVEAERDRLVRWHARLDRSLPTRAVPGFSRRFAVVTETLTGPRGEFPAYVVTPRGIDPERTVVLVHGGGFVAPLDPFHVRYATRLATALRARVVLPDYPLAPENSWRDSHQPLVDLVVRWAEKPGELVLAGDSAGGEGQRTGDQVVAHLLGRDLADGRDAGGGLLDQDPDPREPPRLRLRRCASASAARERTGIARSEWPQMPSLSAGSYCST